MLMQSPSISRAPKPTAVLKPGLKGRHKQNFRMAYHRGLDVPTSGTSVDSTHARAFCNPRPNVATGPPPPPALQHC